MPSAFEALRLGPTTDSSSDELDTAIAFGHSAASCCVVFASAVEGPVGERSEREIEADVSGHPASLPLGS